MVPSSFMISQQTPAGWSPAMRTRSMVASVWPARRSTPPGTARSGKTWPGCTKSLTVAFGSARVRMVRERSPALMPVVMSWAASTETVKAVDMFSRLTEVMSGSWRVSARSGERGAQMRPLAWVAMKLMASGAANSAAMMRSASFSRPGSSVTMIIRPCRISSTASSTEQNWS